MHVLAPPNSILGGIEAIHADDVWAVGWHFTRVGSQTLVMHFDGRRWSQVQAPSPGRRYAALMSVSASSPANVWAAGSGGPGGEHGIVLRYDGSRWTEVDLPAPISNNLAHLSAIGVAARNDVWVVGNGGPLRHNTIPPLALHFDGKGWTRSHIPEIEGRGSLADVEVLGPNEVWAAGDHGGRPLGLLRTNSWQETAIEDPQVPGELAGLAGDGKGSVWAVGEKGGSQWVIQRACEPLP